MRKCPDCAEENISESLFCKHCGRCLLAPDPEVVRLSLATHTDHITPEGIDLSERLLVRKSEATIEKRRRLPGLSVYRKPLMLLNLLVVILISHIIVTLMSR